MINSDDCRTSLGFGQERLQISITSSSVQSEMRTEPTNKLQIFNALPFVVFCIQILHNAAPGLHDQYHILQS